MGNTLIGSSSALSRLFLNFKKKMIYTRERRTGRRVAHGRYQQVDRRHCIRMTDLKNRPRDRADGRATACSFKLHQVTTKTTTTMPVTTRRAYRPRHNGLLADILHPNPNFHPFPTPFTTPSRGAGSVCVPLSSLPLSPSFFRPHGGYAGQGLLPWHPRVSRRLGGIIHASNIDGIFPPMRCRLQRYLYGRGRARWGNA